MSGYSFRLKLLRAAGCVLDIDADLVEWQPTTDIPPLILRSGSKNGSIKDADLFIVESHGWSSEQAAYDGASRYLPALYRAFAKLLVGVDAGRRAPSPGGMSEYLIQGMYNTHGVRIINDKNGLMVYRSEPPPRFASASASLHNVVPKDRLDTAFRFALQEMKMLSEREATSLDLFNASYFQKSADSRFFTLVFAIEALLEPIPRSVAARKHVEQMLELTRNESSLTKQEKESIKGSLLWLRNESIRQTGMKYVSRALGERRYKDMSAAEFFSHCYNLRSSLAHGVSPLPSHSDISSAAANLEIMVSNLLSGNLLDRAI
jgi:hypothetical protein